MAEEFTLDMSKVFRRKRRSKSDSSRYWNSRYKRFLAAGFTNEEARKAANDGLSIKNKQVKQVLRHREALVDLLITYHGLTREQAVQEASKDLKTKLDKAGEEELNLFYEVSP